MATKKQSKPSKKPTTKSKDIDKQVLSAIEKELLKCAKNGQPVLLYGKDTIGREDLIRKVHIKNGGIDASWEHVEGGGQFKSEKDMVKEVQKTIKDYMKEYELLEIQQNWKTTSRTWIPVDCAVLNGKGVFEKLTHGYSYSILLMKYYYLDSLDTDDFPKGGSWFNWYPYFMRSGLLFINNLDCKLGDEEDTYYYKKLATVIEKRKNNDHASGNWFVAYTRDPNDFPEHFRNQFKEISLDSRGDKPVAIEVDRYRGLLKYNGKKSKSKLIPIQLKLLKLLYDKRNTLVTRKEILDTLWSDSNVYDQQITDHINKIRTAFEEIGFEKEVVKKKIIETIKKSRTTDGGYEFHSDIVLLDFH